MEVLFVSVWNISLKSVCTKDPQVDKKKGFVCLIVLCNFVIWELITTDKSFSPVWHDVLKNQDKPWFIHIPTLLAFFVV